MFPRIRVSGAWTNGTTVPGSQWEQFDENLSHAIDGLNGGAYAIAADLVIGGDPGVQITFGVELELQDNLSVAGTASFHGDLIATGDTYLGNVLVNGQAEFTEDVVFSGGGVTFDHSAFFNYNVTLGDGAGDDIIVNGALDCTAVAAFRDTVEFDEEITCNGGASINGPLGVAERLSLSGPLRCFDGGYIKRRLLRVTSTLIPLSPLEYDYVLFEATYAGIGVWAVDTTGVEDGGTMIFVSQSSTPVFVSLGAVGASLCADPGTSGIQVHKKRAEFVREGGDWFLFDSTVA